MNEWINFICEGERGSARERERRVLIMFSQYSTECRATLREWPSCGKEGCAHRLQHEHRYQRTVQLHTRTTPENQNCSMRWRSTRPCLIIMLQSRFIKSPQIEERRSSMRSDPIIWFCQNTNWKCWQKCSFSYGCVPMHALFTLCFVLFCCCFVFVFIDLSSYLIWWQVNENKNKTSSFSSFLFPSSYGWLGR